MCIFCNIEEKKLILVTSRSLVIVNKYPLGVISFLCIPKPHVSSITELSLGEYTDLMYLVKDITQKVKKNFNPLGINIFINEGVVAGQSIEHLHVHIVARGADDNLKNFERFGELIPITEEEILSVKKTLLKRGP